MHTGFRCRSLKERGRFKDVGTKEYNIKMDFEGISSESVDYIHMAVDVNERS